MTKNGKRENAIWVYCEMHGGAMRPVGGELLGKARALAEALQTEVTAILIGSDLKDAAQEAIACGADSVLCVDDAALADADELRTAEELTALVRAYNPSALLMGATAFGRSLAPRLAARLQTGLTADCTALSVDKDKGLILQTRPAFGGHLMATIICPDARPQMATVRPKVFPAPVKDFARTGTIESVPSVSGDSPVKLLERIAFEEGVRIGDADILVSVGQGIGGAENIRLAEQLAQRLGGALSASRPMIDAGLLPYARQVGQTGKTVAPKLYIALGISGAIQHMAGVAAENIVAVNTDPDAPIFQYAKYAVVADCGTFLRELLEKMG